MHIKKEENILKKIVKKDYKNELEEVLENKKFDENAKSLLLEILYKIETAYKDYEITKRDAQTKEEYIENFLFTIQKECKKIVIIRPNSKESKIPENKTFIIDKQTGEIACLPIARKLLYAIYKLEKKEKIVSSKYSILSKTLTDLINIGDCINKVEPLRDFNGWSWTTVSKEIESIEYNLIYQILVILTSQKLLSDWVKNGDSIIDYVEKFEKDLLGKYGLRYGKEMMFAINKLSILMELKINPQIKEEIENSKKNIKIELEKFENKEEYIKELTYKKNKLKKAIMKIDTKINDKNLLQEEYMKRNEKLPLEKKIFSMRVLANIMVKEREHFFKEMEECNELLKPEKFLTRKEELQKKYNILKFAEIGNVEKELKEKIYAIQLIFLECFKTKIDNVQTKQELINLIYQFRYYCTLPINLNEYIYNFEKIKNKLDEVGKFLINKAIKNKVIIQCAPDEELNYLIIKSIFQIRTITLEELSIKINNEKENIYVQFFDEKTFDQKVKLDIENIQKKDLKIRINKKVKIFE